MSILIQRPGHDMAYEGAITSGKTSLWLTPIPEQYWPYTQSIGMIKNIFENRMVPMTLDGISNGMKLIT